MRCGQLSARITTGTDVTLGHSQTPTFPSYVQSLTISHFLFATNVTTIKAELALLRRERDIERKLALESGGKCAAGLLRAGGRCVLRRT